jgi:ribosomal protein S27AE
MTRQFCDRCGADVTQKRSASVRIVSDADSQGNGAVTSDADLCPRCRRALETWLTGAILTKPMKPTKPHESKTKE